MSSLFCCLSGCGTGSSNNSGGGKQTLSLSERTFKRITQTSSNTTHSGGTVSVKQEGSTVDNLVPGFVDSTTFVTSPTVQQTNARQQGSSQTAEQRTGEDCESVPLPSKSLRFENLLRIFCSFKLNRVSIKCENLLLQQRKQTPVTYLLDSLFFISLFSN